MQELIAMSNATGMTNSERVLAKRWFEADAPRGA
jgi:uncharacterized membrane protein